MQILVYKSKKYKILKSEEWGKKTPRKVMQDLKVSFCLVCSPVADSLQSSEGDSVYCATLLPWVVFTGETLTSGSAFPFILNPFGG